MLQHDVSHVARHIWSKTEWQYNVVIRLVIRGVVDEEVLERGKALPTSTREEDLVA